MCVSEITVYDVCVTFRKTEKKKLSERSCSQGENVFVCVSEVVVRDVHSTLQERKTYFLYIFSREKVASSGERVRKKQGRSCH